MASPRTRVFVDFSADTIYETNPLILNSATEGILNTNTLGSGTLPVEITDLVTQINIRRGRNRITSKFEPGTADVVLYDQNGDWNPTNPLSPYYPNLVPLRQIIIYADYGLGRYYLFSGFITNYDTGFRLGNQEVSSVTLRCVDSFRLFANATITTVTGGTAGQNSGARVNSILDMINFPISLRDIDTGDSTLQADPGTQRTVLDALNEVERSEFGGMYLDSQGFCVFKNRNNMISGATTPVYVFSDDGTDISYQNASVQFDDTNLINSVTAQRIGGSVQSAIDQPSIDKYFIHSGNRDNLLVQTDSEALDQAKSILVTRKDPEPRVDSIQINAYDDTNPNKPLSAINVEILEGVTVKKTMPGNTLFTQSSVVIGIHHDITKNSFVTTYFTSEPLIVGFVLNSSISGILNEDVLSY